jgi:hypothetical protein
MRTALPLIALQVYMPRNVVIATNAFALSE